MKKSELKVIASGLRCVEHDNYRSYLAAVYAEAKYRNASYTYADFSTDLGLGSRNVHLVIHGKRNLTEKTATKVIETLGIVKADRRYFLASVDYIRAKTTQDRETAHQRMMQIRGEQLPGDLTRKQIEFFENWYNAAILELLRLPQGSDRPEWLAETIQPKISVVKAKKSLQLLKELGYIAFDRKKGRFFPTGATISTANEVRGMAIYRFHQQMMDLAKMAMDEITPQQREVSAVTLSVSPALQEELKAEIIKLRKRFVQKSNEESDPSEIVQVNFQMFPIASTKRDNKE